MGDGLVKSDRLVTVFGGSGFVGRMWCVLGAARLAGSGSRYAARISRFICSRLAMSGKSTRSRPICAIWNRLALRCGMPNSAVNLVGILQESGAQRFDAIQHLGAQTVAKAVKEAGLGGSVDMSAIGADPSEFRSLRPNESLRRGGGADFPPRCDHLPPLCRVWAEGSILQPGSPPWRASCQRFP